MKVTVEPKRRCVRGMPRIGWNCVAGGDSWDHFPLDTGLPKRFGLLASTPEDERVSPLQANHVLAFSCLGEEQLVDLFLERPSAPLPACRRRWSLRPAERGSKAPGWRENHRPTQSARSRAALPFSVKSPGSPGPAPTKITLPVFAIESCGCSHSFSLSLITPPGLVMPGSIRGMPLTSSSNIFEKFPSPFCQKVLCQLKAQSSAEGAGRLRWRASGARHSGRRRFPVNESCHSGVSHRLRWALASPAQFSEKSPFGLRGDACSLVVQRSDLLRNFLFILPYFNCDHTLSDSRANLLRREVFRNAILESQPVDAGRGHHQRVTVSPFDFLQARVQVAAKVGEFQVRTKVPQLGLPPQAAGADPGVAGEVRKTADCHC